MCCMWDILNVSQQGLGMLTAFTVVLLTMLTLPGMYKQIKNYVFYVMFML